MPAFIEGPRGPEWCSSLDHRLVLFRAAKSCRAFCPRKSGNRFANSKKLPSGRGRGVPARRNRGMTTEKTNDRAAPLPVRNASARRPVLLLRFPSGRNAGGPPPSPGRAAAAAEVMPAAADRRSSRLEREAAWASENSAPTRPVPPPDTGEPRLHTFFGRMTSANLLIPPPIFPCRMPPTRAGDSRSTDRPTGTKGTNRHLAHAQPGARPFTFFPTSPPPALRANVFTFFGRGRRTKRTGSWGGETLVNPPCVGMKKFFFAPPPAFFDRRRFCSRRSRIF